MSNRHAGRVVAFVVAAFALVTVGAFASDAAATRGATEFPEFEAVRPNVEFWKKVYAGWSRSQVAVHDLEHLGVIYEVINLAGPIEDRYTDDQLDFIEELTERWEDRLQELERRVARKKRLSDADKALALQITTRGGTDAIHDAHKRVRTQRGMRERFRRGVEIGERYDTLIRQAFREHGLPEDLAYLPHVESSFQSHARSSAGAVGAWQFTRGTGRRYLSISSALDERLDPVIAADGAARYLRDAYERLQDWPIALTSYNHGVAGMSRAVKAFGRDYEQIFERYEGRLFGFASRNFYAEFLAAREIASDADSYFPEGLELEPPLVLDTIVLESRTTPSLLAQAHGLPVDELAALNPAWSRRAVRSGLALPEGTQVWLPLGTLAELAGRGQALDYALSRSADGAGIYVIQAGDSLSEIASAFGISLTNLRRLNGLGSREHIIYVGQRLRVSEGGDSQAVHVVERGESLSTIAGTYNMKLSELRTLNDISSSESKIYVGQQLHVSGIAAPAVARVHVVRRGESLSTIALRYGVKLGALLRTNSLSLRSIIHPGQRIRIP